MYSVVLMVALTGGGDVPAGLFSHGCCGGGCYGGCFGGGCHGCCGGGHGHRSHGCCGGGCFGGGHGCCGGYGCCGGGYGCCGGGYGCCGGGCYGGGCYGGGCYGGACLGGSCLGGAGCVGGVGGVIGAPVQSGTTIPSTPAVPYTPTTPAKPEKEDGKKTSIDNAAPATIVVNVPADARLTVDGEATTSTSTPRVFVSPSLQAGREYHYTLKAEFVKDGKPVTVSKEVAVRAGQETRVTLDAASLAGVASR